MENFCTVLLKPVCIEFLSQKKGKAFRREVVYFDSYLKRRKK